MSPNSPCSYLRHRLVNLWSVTRRRPRLILLALLLGCLSFPAAAFKLMVEGQEILQKAASPAPAQPVPTPVLASGKVAKIAAVVNNEVITYSDLLFRVQMVKVRIKENKGVPPPDSELRKQVLERMILDRAQLQLAHDFGIVISDEQLDRAMNNVAEADHKTLAQLISATNASGLPYPLFREEIRNEIAVSRLRESQVRIQVSDNEVDNYLSMQALVGKGEEYHVRHILIRTTNGMSPQEVRQQELKAMQMLKRFRSGQSFTDMAVAFSDAPDANEGGDLGWRSLSKLPNIFHDVLKTMQPLDISDIIRSPAGFHIIYLQAKRLATEAGKVEQTRARHILLKIDAAMSDSEAESKLNILRLRVLQGESFAELARLNSQDGSAIKGGDLGWLYPGDTVPEFEKVMEGLRLGEISQPVKSRFGYHLIQVQDRRVAEVDADRRRQMARQVLYQRKTEEAYDEWLQQLRDRTYVENRLEAE